MPKKHPYIGQPDYKFWKHEPAIHREGEFDPINKVGFTISDSEKIVTAGSCFAQHVARYLTNNGFNHYVTEKPHPVFSKELSTKHNYGLFSARYGNIYTARQLKQLLLRSYGLFSPKEKSWRKHQDNYVDPFRPQIQPGGFVSEGELQLDVERHLSHVKEAFENMDVFVFTLGLTECWIDKRDGAVFPLAPGVAGGIYDPDIFEFRNFKYQEYVEDLLYALTFIRERNPSVKIILTVSPVPLNATMENKHVYVATAYSKACLRLAAEEVTNIVHDCDYFPSYEIITSPYSRGMYYGPDCREILPAGVDNVMNIFGKHYFSSTNITQVTMPQAGENESNHISDMEKITGILCDEESISNKI